MGRLRRIEPGDGLLLKSVRLAALEDAPDAFSATLGTEAARTDDEWAERAEAGSSGMARLTLFAVGEQGVIGLVGGYRATKSSTTVELVSMWVNPNTRRTGVGDAAHVEPVARRAADGDPDRLSSRGTRGRYRMNRLQGGFRPVVRTRPTLAFHGDVVRCVASGAVLCLVVSSWG